MGGRGELSATAPYKTRPVVSQVVWTLPGAEFSAVGAGLLRQVQAGSSLETLSCQVSLDQATRQRAADAGAGSVY